MARSFTGPERSAEYPQREASITRSPSMRPSSPKPTSHSKWKSCRLPVIVMSASPIGPQLHGAAGANREDGRSTREERGLAFLAAESAAHAPAFHRDVLRAQVERVGHEVLDLGGMLRGGIHAHRAVFQRHRGGDLAFEVEMILAPDGELALQAMLCPRECCRRIAAHHPFRGDHEALRRERRRNIEDRGQDLVVDLRCECRTPRRLVGCRRHGEDRLAHALDEARREDRIVVEDRAEVVLARDITRGRRSSTTPGAARTGREIHGADARVRHAAHPERGMQRVGGQFDVVDVRSPPAHVQVRALLGAGLSLEQADGLVVGHRRQPAASRFDDAGLRRSEGAVLEVEALEQVRRHAQVR